MIEKIFDFILMIFIIFSFFYMIRVALKTENNFKKIVYTFYAFTIPSLLSIIVLPAVNHCPEFSSCRLLAMSVTIYNYVCGFDYIVGGFRDSSFISLFVNIGILTTLPNVLLVNLLLSLYKKTNIIWLSILPLLIIWYINSYIHIMYFLDKKFNPDIYAVLWFYSIVIAPYIFVFVLSAMYRSLIKEW